jgi:hypothetical protein
MGFVSPKISLSVACVTFACPGQKREFLGQLCAEGLKREFESQPCAMAKKAKNPKASPQNLRLARRIFGQACSYWLVLRTSPKCLKSRL